MAIDPVDDCNFWYAQEYSPANGEFNWATHLFSFKFNACIRLVTLRGRSKQPPLANL